MFKSAPSLELIKKQTENRDKIYFASRYKFLSCISGIRPGCSHGLLAPTGMGKSTLIRSIIADTSEFNKVGVILSEEKAVQYASGFITQSESVIWDNIKFARESDFIANNPTKEQQLNAIVSYAIESDLKVLFWDNVTTGTILGDSVKPDAIGMLWEVFIGKLFEAGIALFFVAHTSKAVKTEQSSLFQGEDVRGSNQAYMKADYFYNLQVKTKNDERIAFVKIAKHRYHQPKNIFFILEFIVNKFTRDAPVPHSVIQELFEKPEKPKQKKYENNSNRY